MSDTVKAAWIGAGATVITALIAGVVSVYLGVWAPKEKVAPLNVILTKAKSDTNTDNSSKDDAKIYTNTSEKNINKIFIGMGRSHAKSLFGIPLVEVNHDFNNTLEIDYSFDRFYLQLVFSKSGSLTFYSVVSKDKDFFPCIPKLGKCIGKHTFSQMTEIEGGSGRYSHTYLYSYLTSKHYGYGEYLYLGNVGNYHNYYLGYNSLGVNYSDIFPFTKYGKTNSEWELFRTTNKPNSFGVGDMSSVDDENLHYEIGPEYYTFRNL